MRRDGLRQNRDSSAGLGFSPDSYAQCCRRRPSAWACVATRVSTDEDEMRDGPVQDRMFGVSNPGNSKRSLAGGQDETKQVCRTGG